MDYVDDVDDVDDDDDDDDHIIISETSNLIVIHHVVDY
jgi:hypothetical protein